MVLLIGVFLNSRLGAPALGRVSLGQLGHAERPSGSGACLDLALALLLNILSVAALMSPWKDTQLH